MMRSNTSFFREDKVLYVHRSYYAIEFNLVYVEIYPKWKNKKHFEQIIDLIYNRYEDLIPEKKQDIVDFEFKVEKSLEGILEQMQRCIIERKISSNQIGAIDNLNMDKFYKWYWHEAKE